MMSWKGCLCLEIESVIATGKGVTTNWDFEKSGRGSTKLTRMLGSVRTVAAVQNPTLLFGAMSAMSSLGEVLQLTMIAFGGQHLKLTVALVVFVVVKPKRCSCHWTM
jgi:hypothetical protein